MISTGGNRQSWIFLVASLRTLQDGQFHSTVSSLHSIRIHVWKGCDLLRHILSYLASSLSNHLGQLGELRETGVSNEYNLGSPQPHPHHELIWDYYRSLILTRDVGAVVCSPNGSSVTATVTSRERWDSPLFCKSGREVRPETGPEALRTLIAMHHVYTV